MSFQFLDLYLISVGAVLITNQYSEKRIEDTQHRNSFYQTINKNFNFLMRKVALWVCLGIPNFWNIRRSPLQCCAKQNYQSFVSSMRTSGAFLGSRRTERHDMLHFRYQYIGCGIFGSGARCIGTLGRLFLYNYLKRRTSGARRRMSGIVSGLVKYFSTFQHDRLKRFWL